jgi:GTPase
MTPLVAIIGRPNVGKSTLFNRLIGRRKSIIDPTPGVTRDALYGDVVYEERRIKLIDTGGLSDDEDELNSKVQKRSLEAITDADLVLFLVESQNPLPIELEYIDIVRKSSKKCIIAVNKCDSPEKDDLVNEYYKYGIGEPIPISAAHNRNIDVLMEKIIGNFPADGHHDETPVDEDTIKIAIVGKPNVGKSSILNKMSGRERSIVSPIAGTTRDVVDEKLEFSGKKFIILDTAGIRRKSKVTENIEYYSVNRAIKTIENADVTLLVIDSLEDISDQDKKITDQIIKNGKGLIVVLNKWDLVEKNPDILREKKDILLFKFPQISFAPIIPVSAISGKGIDNLLKTSITIHRNLHKRIGTSQLNGFIEEITKKYTPTSKKGFIKIYYATQTNTTPVEFVFFINKKRLLTENYQQYIVNRFREKFGFVGVPLKIYFRDKKKSE